MGKITVVPKDDKVPVSTIEALVGVQAKQMRQRFDEASIRFKHALDLAKKRELIVSVIGASIILRHTNQTLFHLGKVRGSSSSSNIRRQGAQLVA